MGADTSKQVYERMCQYTESKRMCQYTERMRCEKITPNINVAGDAFHCLPHYMNAIILKVATARSILAIGHSESVGCELFGIPEDLVIMISEKLEFQIVKREIYHIMYYYRDQVGGKRFNNWMKTREILLEIAQKSSIDGSRRSQLALTYSLMYSSEELRGDREIVLATVQKCGRAIQWASKELRGDRDIVLTAVRENGIALYFASEELQNDPELVRIAKQVGCDY